MIVEHTSLPDVVVVRSPVHGDARGFFMEVFHENRFAELGLPTHFAQDSHSRSSKGVLRGLHFQLENPQGKLVRAVSGTIFDVAVDLRRSSPNFGRWTGVTLEAGDGRQLWVPPGFGHGFFVLSDFADVSYKCTTVYHADSNRSVRWDDPSIGVRWPIEPGRSPLLSPKDAAAAALDSEHSFA
jgi:dTDP-4-dehydrorhamnose 3,5-epimerase